MPAQDEVEAVAVLLPAPDAARVAVELWDEGEAVVPLDPAAPAPDLERSLAALRPTALVDPDGRHRRPDGIPAAAGVAAIVATSGTTGERKGVELTFAGLKASGAAVASALGGAPDGGWLCCLPLHLVAGLAVVGRAWATGSPFTVQSGFDPAAIVETAGGAAAFVSLVPTMLRRLLDADPGGAAAFDHILLGGGSIDPALLDRARAAGATVSTTYGMTETWGGIVHNGHPLPGVELRLDPEVTGADDTAMADGVAEILVRAPMLMRGYRLWPEGTAAAIDANGWYRTGDLGRFDPEAGGRLWIVDRVGDVVNTGGVKVSPTEVERVLAGHPAVAEVCVAGRPDPEWGQRVVAFVVPAAAADPPALADLRAYAREHLTPAKLPREVVLVDAIPRTAGGKPLRRLLRDSG
ncbi:MAG TPA: fatty acid--CoA ligase family protein [Acidimicrobiia bacterium]|jgi:O-succinylbenzoic acid--CoA ligase|nr:fatty acid--CoA ligase family protein [Acidimicrobiia bacterium]